MPPDWVIEPVDVPGDGISGLLAGLPGNWPDRLRLDGLEEGKEDQKTELMQWLPPSRGITYAKLVLSEPKGGHI